MDVLDDIRERQANVKPYDTAMRYGLIAGGISVIFGLVFYLMEIVDQKTSYITLAALFVVIFMAAVHHRDKELEGRMLYGRGLGVGVLTSLCAGLIGAVWIYIFMAFIAPDYAETLMDTVRETWDEQGLTEEQIEAAEGMTSKMFTPPAMAIMSVVGTVFWGFIGSLIIAAITQRK